MENKNKTVISYAVVSIALLVFGIYTSTINYANAVSVVSVTFPGGTTTRDVTYRPRENSDTQNDKTSAYIIGTSGGAVIVWRKSDTTNSLIANLTLTGSISPRAIEYNPDALAVYATTNDKFWKLSTAPAITVQLASGTANVVSDMIYDDTNNVMYFCYNDGLGSVNLVTLTPSTIFADAGVNAVRGCAIDEANQILYLVGDDMGASGTCEIEQVLISSATEIDCVNTDPLGDTTLDAVCYDDVDDKIWAVSGTAGRVKKFNSTLDVVTNVATSATPRQCDISTDDTARRLYVTIQSNDTVSIIDIDANVILTSPTVCNVGSVEEPDVRRLFNTTNVFVTCSDSTNSIITDDTVSEESGGDVDDTSCNNPANANLLRCRLGEDDGLGGLGESVGNSVLVLGCNVIFVSCDDTNPQTNGLGLLAFIASIFVVIGMFYYTIGKDAFSMPLFVYIIIIVALSAFFTITGLIDPVFLIISIIAVVALAVPKVISIVRGGGSTFGGGSSA